MGMLIPNGYTYFPTYNNLQTNFLFANTHSRSNLYSGLGPPTGHKPRKCVCVCVILCASQRELVIMDFFRVIRQRSSQGIASI